MVSALLPLVNAEAYALIAATRPAPPAAVAVVLALAVGQTVGKLVLFEAARRGSARLPAVRRPDRLAHRPLGRPGCGLMTRRRTGLPLVLASASIGLPPLAVVSLAAGVSNQPRWEFAAACLVGRTARFAVLTLPAVYALGATSHGKLALPTGSCPWGRDKFTG